MKRQCLFVCFLSFFVFVSAVNAELTEIGTATYLGSDYKLIYMDDSPFGAITWLDYSSGRDNWHNQDSWASSLGLDLVVSLYPGYTTNIEWETGWRLPLTDESEADLTGPWSTDVGRGDDGFGWGGPDANGYHDYWYGYNMLNSELGYLYYEALGNTGYYYKDGTYPHWEGLENTGDFDNLMAEYAYWSATDFSPNTDEAWRTSLYLGMQWKGTKAIEDNYALAVRPGNVSPVPEPSTILLLGAGLLGLAGARRRSKK